MRTTPKTCNCNSCKCGIYTYEDLGICKACNGGNHLSGAIKKEYTANEEPTKMNG